ncbi:efflux transporter outer membrane subunit [Massilia horti]|uniref:Efflux transporter outer membrane subunit n=1 Tax=Massilia horti TaxID=2562153 RepID=A0A4Y9T6W3_9BURK|nr:efflux transporter outer membrane subunit [Massilia horti]TFW34669.1 efflux transporter outer membrane subunit [Massilia horti]
MRLFSPALAAALTAGALLALAGCAHVPADTAIPATPDFARVQHAASIKLARDAWPVREWWREYRDPQLDNLVARALNDAPTLAVARARLAAARAAVAGERAAAGVQTGLTAGLNRERYSSNGLFPPPIGGAWFNDTSVQVGAAYEFDWWGRHRAQVASALGEENARQAEASQAEQLLTAAVAQSYFRLQMLWARQDNADQLALEQRQLVEDRTARIKHGLATIDERRSAELELATLLEQASRYQTQAARERETLRALIGADSEALENLQRRVPLSAPGSLPQQLGIELLARRPDLQAARWRVESALGRVKASEAAFYPSLNLSAAIGLDSVSLEKLLRYGSRTLLAGAALDLPLFDSGRLEAGLAADRARRDEIIADYNQSVVGAVREVAEEGATLQGIDQQQKTHLGAVLAAAQLEDHAKARFSQGLLDRAALIQARIGVLHQHDVSLQIIDAKLQTQVALVKALGGGYRAAPTQAVSAQH